MSMPFDVARVFDDWPEEKTLHWRSRHAAGVVHSRHFEAFSATVILTSLALLVVEVNADAKCFPEYLQSFAECPMSSLRIGWLEAANTAVLLIYSLECLARAYVDGYGFLCSCFNLIDVATVIVGWSGKMWTSALNMNFLRVFRLLRICQSSRMVLSVPELRLLVLGLLASLKAFLWAAALVTFVLFLWAIVAVETIHPITSSLGGTSARAFANVWLAALTLFQQTVAKDGWRETSLPAVEAAPWTALIFFAILVSVSFGLVNLALVLILECALGAHETSRTCTAQCPVQRNVLKELALRCSAMDAFQRGMVSVSELLRAYEEDEVFREMLVEAGVPGRPQLETMCNVLKMEYSEEIRTDDFLQHVQGLKQRDPAASQALMEYAVLELRRLLPRGERPAPQVSMDEASPGPEALRKRWARHCLQSFETLQRGLQPLLVQAERVLLDTLEDTGFEPPSQVCHIDIDVHDASPDVPSRSDWILDQRSVVLAETLRSSSLKMQGLQEKMYCIQQRLNKIRSGFDGRAESL